MVLLVLAACRTDHLQEEKARNEASESMLRSKIISLNESAHKSKIAPLLLRLKQSYKNNKTGKNVSFGDSISINTDHVIYIENGPNYHTYTFNIKRNNPLPDNPVENLLLTPLPNGTYKEFLVTYNFTQQEKDQILLGNSFDYADKVTAIELANGTFTDALLDKTVCGYGINGYYTWCSENKHNNGETTSCKATEYKSEYVVELTYSCYDDLSPGTGGVQNPGEGGNNGGDGGTGGGKVPCSEGSFLEPTDPETAASGCNTGVPTLPNLEDISPCRKTKVLVNKPKIKDSINSYNAFAAISLKKEKGMQELKNGTLLAGSVTKDFNMQFGIGSASLGTIHVHPIKGIAMFSPRDILTFLHLLREQDSLTINSAYSGMISAGGNYFITFTGSTSNIPPVMTVAEEEIYVTNLSKWYQKKFHQIRREEGVPYGGQISNKGREKLFFDMLRLMNLNENIKIIKEDNGQTSSVIEGLNGGLNLYIPC